jgi:hypothetical protein
MEKVEKHLTINKSNKKGKNLIRASTILEITLEDYHQSRKLYGQGDGISNIQRNPENNQGKEKLNKVEENLFDEFEEEGITEEQNRRVSFNRMINKNTTTTTKTTTVTKNVFQNEINALQGKTMNAQERSNKLKSIISNYIKERELDMYS